MSRGYFAFVRRDADRRYHATLPDFPGCTAEADTLEALTSAVRETVREQARSTGWPAATRLEALPRAPGDHEGFWLMVDFAHQG
ncbi:type II toxin-antitoxin system HicB family antitoxin [Cognatilysobacter terrigena]|uniref:type II toxin-antitoxin system HicB family antitoxin n=1 Tax=Cognatilysobacter terrigena TaxID=2488749 RepID=UPI0010616949|nr:type II toxin-antitoxin system HicB family antitoxin [Lysobacter terrigena]